MQEKTVITFRDKSIETIPWVAGAVGLAFTFATIAAQSFAEQLIIMLVSLAVGTSITFIRVFVIESQSFASTLLPTLVTFVTIGQMVFVRLSNFLPVSLKVITAILAIVYILIFLVLSIIDIIRVLRPVTTGSPYRINAALINIVFLAATAGTYAVVGIYARHVDAGFDPLFAGLLAAEMFITIFFVWFRMVTIDIISNLYIGFILMVVALSIGDFMLPFTHTPDNLSPSTAFMLYALTLPPMFFTLAYGTRKELISPRQHVISQRFLQRTSYLMVVTSMVPVFFLVSPESYSVERNFALTFVIGALIVAWLWELLRVREAEFTTQKDLEARLRERDRIDPVSGLTNRVSWMEHLLTTLQEESHGVSIAYVKIIGLAGITDSHGFKAYDTAIRKISARLQALLGEGDDVSLFSNELFSIVFTKEHTKEELQAALERILLKLSTSYDMGKGQLVHIRCNAGGVVCRVHESPSVAIQFLDQSIELADKHGLGQTLVLTTDDKETVSEMSHLVEEVTRAVNMGDMQLQFRPIVKLEDASCAAMAVDPVFGNPAITLDILKDNQDLLDIVEEPYLTEACYWSVRADCPILVHVYIRERNALSIVDTLTSVISDTNISPDNITVLVSGRPADGTSLQAVLNPLSVLGISIALDQYQSHDVSIIELLDLPVSMLVIDFAVLAKQIPAVYMDDYIQRSIELVLSMGSFVMVSNIDQVDVGLDFLDSEARYGTGDVFGPPSNDAQALTVWRSKATFSPIEPSSYAL